MHDLPSSIASLFCEPLKGSSKIKTLPHGDGSDIDRRLGRDPHATMPEDRNYAFYSGDPGGSGNEIWYSFPEVFMLWLALRLEFFGLTQTTVIQLLRAAQTDP